MTDLGYITQNPCVLMCGTEEYIKVEWILDELELKAPSHKKERILIRIRKLKDNIKEIKCVPRMPISDEQTEIESLNLGKIAFTTPNGLKAIFYRLLYRKDRTKEMIKIWFDGVEPALDVFGNLPKQLMNFAEMGGRIIQIDVGEKEQSIGDCVNKKKDIIPQQCRQTGVFLWEGDTYQCFKKDGQKIHCNKDDSFCIRCAQILIEGAYIRCPIHVRNHQDSDKIGIPLKPVKEN